MALSTLQKLQGLPARADSLSHSLAVSAAIRGSSLESDVQAAENIEQIAKKVGPFLIFLRNSIVKSHPRFTRQSTLLFPDSHMFSVLKKSALCSECQRDFGLPRSRKRHRHTSQCLICYGASGGSSKPASQMCQASISPSMADRDCKSSGDCNQRPRVFSVSLPTPLYIALLLEWQDHRDRHVILSASNYYVSLICESCVVYVE